MTQENRAKLWKLNLSLQFAAGVGSGCRCLYAGIHRIRVVLTFLQSQAGLWLSGAREGMGLILQLFILYRAAYFYKEKKQKTIIFKLQQITQ